MQMPDISPYIWRSVDALIHATGVGHLALVASIAVGSSVVNYYLDARGHTLAVKLLNRSLWIVGGIIALDIFFKVLTKTQMIFHL